MTMIDGKCPGVSSGTHAKSSARFVPQDVLLGVEERDWPKIGQVVLEVHAVLGRLGRIRGLLRDHGFTVRVEVGALRSSEASVVHTVRVPTGTKRWQ